MFPLTGPLDIQTAFQFQEKTKRFMQKIEFAPSKFDVKELTEMTEKLTAWFTPLTNPEIPLPPSEIKDAYYRAFFNLTTERIVRTHLTASMLPLVMRVSRRNPSPILVASVSNMVFEEETKKTIVENLDGMFTYILYLQSQNDVTVVHAVRGIFSLTTVYDYKYRFCIVPHILNKLVDCVTLMNDSLAMNAVGSLANMAIHPKCKSLIVQAGALPKLQELAEHIDSETVLHQVARCLFSLAADKSIRADMCRMGFLDSLHRMMTIGVDNNDIMTNSIGCFGNLAMSEPEAQNSTLIERVVPVFVTSTDPFLDRQCARALSLFCTKPNVKALLAPVNIGAVFIEKIERCMTAANCDTGMLRDMLGVFASIVYKNHDLREFAIQKAFINTLYAVWEKFVNHEDVLCNVLRSLFSMAFGDKSSKCVFSKPRNLKFLCETASSDECSGTLRKLALSGISMLSRVPCMRKSLLRVGALETAVCSLFVETTTEARKHAYSIVNNLTGPGLCSFGEHAVASGGHTMTEMYNLERCLQAWIKRSQDETSLPMRTFECVEGTVTIRLYEPLIRVRCPQMLTKTDNIPKVSRKAWLFFNELMHSACVRGTHNDGPTREATELAEAFGFRPTDDDGGSKRWKGEEMDFERALPRVWNWAEFERILVETRPHVVDEMLSERIQTDIVFRVANEGIEEADFNWPDDAHPPSPFIADMIKRWSTTECDTSSDSTGVAASTDDGKMTNEVRQPPKYTYISAHREILAERSHVFGMLLKGDWCESKEKTFDFDFSIETLAVFLRYVYFGMEAELENAIFGNVKLLWSVIRMAHKYQLTGLLSRCEYALAKRCLVTPETAIAIIAHADGMHLPCLWAMVFSAYHTSVGPQRGKFNRALEKYPQTKAVFDENIRIQATVVNEEVCVMDSATA